MILIPDDDDDKSLRLTSPRFVSPRTFSVRAFCNSYICSVKIFSFNFDSLLYFSSFRQESNSESLLAGLFFNNIFNAKCPFGIIKGR